MKKKGFSIAEAMITLLIISIAMAASAPLLTKKVKSSTISNVSIINQNKNVRIYSDGFKECWITTNANTSGNYITLPVAFSDNTYTALVSNNSITNVHPIIEEKTTNSIKIAWREGGARNTGYHSDYYVSIYAAGY